MTPLAPGLTRHTACYMAEKGVAGDRLVGWLKIWDDTCREDNEITAIQYESLKRGRQLYNRHVAGREQTAQHINAMIWRDYRAVLQDNPVP